MIHQDFSYNAQGLMMHPIQNSILIMAIVLSSACSSTGQKYKKDDVKIAYRICLEQSNADKLAMNRQWFTRWISCVQERVMPIEIYYYPEKERDIRSMYERLFVLAEDVDSGKSQVEPVYAEWDRMKRELKMATCKIKMIGPNGSEECVSH